MKEQKTPLAKDVALGFVQTQGWAVFPIYEALSTGKCACGKPDCNSPAKHPRTSDGFKSATKDSEKINQWWTQHPCANIGVATGATSGFFALDIDPKNGGDESFRKLIAEHGELPTTVLSLTGGDGQHYLFQYPPDTKIPNKTNLRQGIDIRGDGGYIVVPPSNHISGGTYRWAENKSPNDIALVQAPQWLLNLITQRDSTKANNFSSSDVIAEGGRNSSLTSIAGNLRRKGLSEEETLTLLLEKNNSLCKPPLSEAEVKAIVQSISKYANGELKPLVWTEMKDLPHIAYSSPELDEKMIPKPLRKWAVDISERMQISLDFIAPMMLVVASSVIGRQVAVRPKEHDSYEVIPNIWGALIAPPSSMKSPAISEAMSPLYKLTEQAKSLYNQAKKESEHEIYKLESDIKHHEKMLNKNFDDRDLTYETIKNLKEELEKLKPKEHRFFTNDSTVEKLVIILGENANGILIQRDELSGFLNTFEKVGHEADRSFYLEGWSGNGVYQVDRVGRESVFVQGMCISVLGGIQPARIKEYISDVISNSAGNDGLIQRFQMLIYPELRKNWVLIDRPPLYSEKEKVSSIFSELADMDLSSLDPSFDGNDSVPFLRFDSEAQVIYNEWITKLENRLRRESMSADSEAMKSHLGKYRSLMPSLALIIYLIYFADNKLYGGSIPAWAAKLAVRWCDYLEAHAKKVYGLLGELQLDSARAFIKKVQEGRIKDGDSFRDIYRHHWSNLENVKKVENAIALLSEHGWCQTQYISNGGAPSEIVRLNPKWLETINLRAKNAKSRRPEASGTSDTLNNQQIH